MNLLSLKPEWVSEREWRSFLFKMENWGGAECPACGKPISRHTFKRHCESKKDERHRNLLHIWRKLRGEQ